MQQACYLSLDKHTHIHTPMGGESWGKRIYVGSGCIYVGSGWFLASLMRNSSMCSIALLEGELKIIVNITDSLVKRPPVALLPRGCLLGKRLGRRQRLLHQRSLPLAWRTPLRMGWPSLLL